MKNSETHRVCNKHNIGGKSVCCDCTGKTDCSSEVPDTTQTTPSEEVGIKEVFLANFCDGDSWEAADASSFTKHGALEIANFFYEKGVRDSLEVVNDLEITSDSRENVVDMCREIWQDAIKPSLVEAISTLLT